MVRASRRSRRGSWRARLGWSKLFSDPKSRPARHPSLGIGQSIHAVAVLCRATKGGTTILHRHLDDPGWLDLGVVVDQLQPVRAFAARSEEHTSELQSRQYLVCRL